MEAGTGGVGVRQAHQTDPEEILDLTGHSQLVVSNEETSFAQP